MFISSIDIKYGNILCFDFFFGKPINFINTANNYTPETNHQTEDEG